MTREARSESRAVWTPMLALVACLIGAACAAQKPPLSPTALSATIDTLATRGDSTGLATLAHRQCRSDSTEVRRTCLEDFFVGLAANGRTGMALGALAQLGKAHEDVEREGHGYTHVIGIRAWQPGDDVANVFRGCNGLYQSGCYHGVIQSYLTAEGTLDSTRAVTLCDAVASDVKELWLRFQCVHGLGHGFEMALNWELPAALTRCDWLANGWDRQACYGGAFMENAIASMSGGHHHVSVRALEKASEANAAADHSAHGGMAGMNHAPALGAITFKMRDSTDALYPCSATEPKYRSACYQLQGGIILANTGGRFGLATAACDKVGSQWRSYCYQSLGTNASGMAVQKNSKAIAYCTNGDPDYQPYCFVGVVKNYIDVTAKPADGIAFCKDVPPGKNRTQCFVAVGEQIVVLFPTDVPKREALCSEAGLDGVADCRRGAALPPK
ncbi:MAG: hypothetical protein IPJ11_09505 [Gemmatimonadetes bacterium]|nr:hypothetical protein [Gemmatimonadota bacterium]